MRTLSVLAALALSAAATADTQNGDPHYTCQLKDVSREIRVAYLVEDQPVPCEVRYVREEGTETLWRADNQDGFCERQAGEFADRHRTWGWTCRGHNLPRTEPNEGLY